MCAKSKLLTVAGICFLSVFSCAERPRYPAALTPAQALKAFELEDGFAIDVFATEPVIADPIDLVFDENGKAYVVEMGDYPYKPEAGQGKGKIKVVYDTDGDGVADSAVVFAEGIADATSVLPYDGGLLVAAAPSITFYKDTDGDDVADHEEVLFSGFFEDNSEAQITSLRFGVDNWIYANNNGQRGAVRFTRRPDLGEVVLAGKDFRFRLDRNLFEAESGTGQFGLTMDDWGHRFFTQNTWHLQTAPIPDRYLNRHPDMPSYGSVANIYGADLRAYPISAPPYWRVERSEGRQRQYDAAGLDRVEHTWGHFTGASGGMMYNAALFPEAYHGSVFTAEVALNLVHRDVIEHIDSGPFVVGKRAPEGIEKEFLASTDPWFRPVNATVGPEGALYVVDMYRQHIETPVSIPDTLKEDMDFLLGSERGRIYRIYPEGKRPGLDRPALGKKTSPELVSILGHENQWWRLQAQRLLIERQDRTVVGQVGGLLTAHADPRTRLHALYVLEGLEGLSAELVGGALGDSHPQVRRHALMLAERYPELLQAVTELAADPEAEVAFQAALSLGEFGEKPAVVDALAGLAVSYGDDPWFRKAILSSRTGSSYTLYALLDRQGSAANGSQGSPEFLGELAFAIGSRGDVSAYKQLFASFPVDNAVYEEAVVSGFAGGVQRTALSTDQKKALTAGLKGWKLSVAMQAIAAGMQEKLTGE